MAHFRGIVFATIFLYLTVIRNLFAGISLDYPIASQDYKSGSYENRSFLSPANHLGDDVNRMLQIMLSLQELGQT